ncbi:MAG: DivIVA domain-containing protein [Actinomycetota bacterium]
MNQPIDNTSEAFATAPEQLTPEEVQNTQFSTRVRGYDRDEVDAFLSLVATEIQQLLEHQQLLQKQTPVDLEDAEPYARLGSDAGKLMQLARDHADRMKSEALEAIAADQAKFEAEVTELKQRAETEAAALREMAERDASAVKDEADRLHTEAQTRAREVEIETDNNAARARTEADEIRSAAESEAAALKADVEAEAKRIREKARADYTVLTREAHREANRIEREARQSAELLKDETEEKSVERVRRARAEVRKLREAETTLKRRIQALQSTLDSLSNEIDDDRRGKPGPQPPATVDLTDTRSGPA